jgi:hypothetical protein
LNIKFSDYFLSAVDVVHHSRFSYWFQKYIGGFIGGFVLALVFFFMFFDSGTSSTKEINSTTEISKNSKQTEDLKTSQKPDQTVSQVKPTGFDCGSSNEIIKLICGDKDIININNKFNELHSKLITNGVSKEKLDVVENSLVTNLKNCNLDRQCVYFSFQEAYIKLESFN